MRKIINIFHLINYNLKTLLGFEVLFKLSTIIVTKIFLQAFNIIMSASGFRYLTLENIFSFLLEPKTIILLIILIILMTIYTMFDITTIIIILDCSFHKRKIKISDAILTAFYQCKSIFRLKNITLPILVLFLIPLLNLGITSSFITTIKIPEFITDFIIQNKSLLCLSLCIFVILTSILLKWFYALHYFVIEDKNFKEAKNKSKYLSKGKHIKDILVITIAQLIIAMIYITIIIIGVLLIISLDKIFKDIILAKSATATIIWIFIALSMACMSVLSTPINYACISSLYYFHKQKKKEEIQPVKIKTCKENEKLNQKITKLIIIVFIILFIGGTFFTYKVYQGKYSLEIEYKRDLEVTAHRGASIDYPENTMSAFIGAKKQGADWIELDVQETKDQKIVVVHDSNLKRITNLDKYVWQLTYDEIKNLDSGSFHHKKFKNEKISLLEDVLKWAKKNKIKLNIELKPIGHEKNLEKAVVEIIEKERYLNNCMVTSQVYKTLQKIKKYNKNIKTAYVMSIAYGDILSLKDADAFSIEATNISSSLVKRLHKKGKKIYAWTINTEENIKKMIDLNVDNIITDQVILAKNVIDASKTSNLINEYIKLIEKNLK